MLATWDISNRNRYFRLNALTETKRYSSGITKKNSFIEIPRNFQLSYDVSFVENRDTVVAHQRVEYLLSSSCHGTKAVNHSKIRRNPDFYLDIACFKFFLTNGIVQ